MTRITAKPRWIARAWTAAVETSATAVAIHYSAPWKRGAASRPAERTARGACAA